MYLKLRHIVVYLLIVSVIAMGVSFSRYSTTLTNTGAENSELPDIEFSTWVMDQGAEVVSLKNMQPGDSKTIDIWVQNWKNNGGAAMVSGYDQSFNLELETTGNLPLAFVLYEEGQGAINFTRVDSYHYRSNSLTFSADDPETREFVLTASWPGELKAERYRHEIDYLVLKISAVQMGNEEE